jgi:hypothetical protein
MLYSARHLAAGAALEAWWLFRVDPAGTDGRLFGTSGIPEVPKSGDQPSRMLGALPEPFLASLLWQEEKPGFSGFAKRIFSLYLKGKWE